MIGNGPWWLWRLAHERWPEAIHRLDCDHGVQHLVSVRWTLRGEDQDQFQSWINLLVRALTDALAVEKGIQLLDQPVAGLPAGPQPAGR